MPVCVTCGEKDFHLLDGLYYCVQCHTQTQELNEEEVDNDDVNPSFMLQIRTKKKEKPKKSKREKRDKGRPWHTHEAWTIILRRLVDALIKLGANPKLQDVVLRLWVRYLAKCGVAFTADDSVKSHPSSACRDRDKYVPSVEDPIITDTNYVRGSKQRYSGYTTLQKAKKKKESQLLQQALKNEEFYEGDDPFEKEVPMEEDSSTDGEVEETEETNKKPVNNIKKHVHKPPQRSSYYRDIECMTPYRLLSLCYLGLVYLHPLVVPADIIRWITTDKFPFRYHLFRSLPDDFKFCPSDFKTFWVDQVPKCDTIRRDASNLCAFLALHSYFKTIPLELMCSRYILDMNLPGEFHYLTRCLLKHVPYPLKALGGFVSSARGKTAPLTQVECIAMACVLLVLKLLFGLDGTTEKKIAMAARKIQTMLNLDQGLFVFEDWLHYMEHTQYISQLDPFTASTEDLCNITNMEEFDRIFSQKHEEQRAFSDRNFSVKALPKGKHQSTQDSLQQLFLSLLDKYKIKQEKASHKEDVDSKEDDDRDSLHSSDNSLIALMKESPVHSKKSVEEDSQADGKPLFPTTGEQIRQSTVAYLLDKTFLQKQYEVFCSNEASKKHGHPSGFTQRDTNSGSQSLFSQLDEIDEDLREELRNMDNKTQVESQCGKKDSPQKKIPELEDIQNLQEQLELLTDRTSYRKTGTGPNQDHWRRIYDRTLTVCSEIIGCTKQHLNYHVWLMELYCLPCPDAFTKTWRKTYVKRYFLVDEDLKK